MPVGRVNHIEHGQNHEIIDEASGRSSCHADSAKHAKTFRVLEEARTSISGQPSSEATSRARNMSEHMVHDYSFGAGQETNTKQKRHLLCTGGAISCMSVANSRLLSSVVFAAVFLNGVQMGIQTDLEGTWPSLDNLFVILDNLFTAVFAIEFVVKFSAYKLDYFRDRWNVFDCTLTWISITDMWILAAIGGGAGMKVLAVLRIFRIFRAIRLLRMLRQFRELTLIIEGLITAMGTTTWISMLLMLILYIFSIFCVRSVGAKDGPYPGWNDQSDEYEEGNEFNSYQYFGTIFRAMFTLLNVAMLTDDWFVVSRALIEKQPLILLAFLLFVFFTTFGLLNVIIGIIVENVMESARGLHDDEESLKVKELLSRLEMLYQFLFSLDKDGDEKINRKELEDSWDSDMMKELLRLAELPAGLDPEELMNLIDENGDASLSMEEIVKGFVRLLTSDTNQRMLEIKAQQNSFKKDLKEVQRDISEIKLHLNALPFQIHDAVVEAMSTGRLHPESPWGEYKNTPPVFREDQDDKTEATPRLKYFQPGLDVDANKGDLCLKINGEECEESAANTSANWDDSCTER